MDKPENEQPVACTVCHYVSPARLETCVQHWCPGCLAMRWFGAAAVRPKEPVADTDEARSLQRVGRLCAWWRGEAQQLRAEAAKMDRMGHPRTAEKAGAGALVYETCANILEKALQSEMAGTEPTEGGCGEPAPTGPDSPRAPGSLAARDRRTD